MIFDVESMKKAMVEFEVRSMAVCTWQREPQFCCRCLILRHCHSSLQIDLQKMPLGKLSKRQIQSAYALLTEVQQVSNQWSGPGWGFSLCDSYTFFLSSHLYQRQAVSDSLPESQILDLSNRFYTLIPHDFGMKKPPLLNNLDYIQVCKTGIFGLFNKMILIEHYTIPTLLCSGKGSDAGQPVGHRSGVQPAERRGSGQWERPHRHQLWETQNQNWGVMQKIALLLYDRCMHITACSLFVVPQVIDKSAKEADVIMQYVKNTHAATHNTYTLEVQEVSNIAAFTSFFSVPLLLSKSFSDFSSFRSSKYAERVSISVTVHSKSCTTGSCCGTALAPPTMRV